MQMRRGSEMQRICAADKSSELSQECAPFHLEIKTILNHVHLPDHLETPFDPSRVGATIVFHPDNRVSEKY